MLCNRETYMLREKIKNWKMELAAVLVFVLVLGMTGLSGSVKAADQTDLKTIDIMFVHDTHSHLNSFSTVVDEKQEMIGGFARIKKLIDEQKERSGYTGGGCWRFFHGNAGADRF